MQKKPLKTLFFRLREISKYWGLPVDLLRKPKWLRKPHNEQRFRNLLRKIMRSPNCPTLLAEMTYIDPKHMDKRLKRHRTIHWRRQQANNRPKVRRPCASQRKKTFVAA